MKARSRFNAAASILEQFRELKSDYQIGKSSRYKSRKSGVLTLGSHADYHYRTESAYFGAMETAREMTRNNPLVMQGVRRLVSNVIGRGFVLDADTNDEGMSEELSYRWDEWQKHPDACDIQGEQTFHGMEKLGLQHVFVDGDICHLPTSEGVLESLEGHRLKTPRNTTKNVIHGVHLNDRRRRLGYWFTKEDVDPLRSVNRVGDVVQIEARDANGHRQVLHHYLPDRVSQTRGVTAFAPMADTAEHWDDLQFATLVAHKIQSCYTILREMDAGSPGIPTPGDQGHSESTETRPDGEMRPLSDLAPGFEVYGYKGEKLKGFTPTIPGLAFFPHSELLLGILAVNLDLPLCVFLLDATKTNFSGFRGAIDQARQRWREIQSWYMGSFHSPVYEWKVRQWAVTDATLAARVRRVDELRGSLGYIPPGEVNPFAHVWHAQELPYIQPVDDATADILQAKGLLSSPRRLAAARGIDFSDLTEEIVSDHGQRIRKAHAEAQKLNAELGLQLTWREILQWPMPDGVQISVGNGKDPAPAKQPAKAPAAAPADDEGEDTPDEPGQNRLRRINGHAN